MKQLNLQLQTPYQVNPIQLSNGRAYHRIGIASEDTGAVHVQLDPNICQLDAFGDTAGCTKIAVFSFLAKLRLIEERDGKRLFALDPEEGADKPALRLVLLAERPAGAGHAVSARLLALGAGDAIAAVVALESPPGA